MNTLIRTGFVGLTLALLAFAAPGAFAQDRPSPATPQVEAPDPPAPPQPPQPPQDVERDVTSPTATDDEDIEWTRDRPEPGRDHWPGHWMSHRHHDAIVSIFGHSHLEADRTVESVVSIFGNSTSAGEVTDSIVSIFGDTRVEGGVVHNAAVTVFGDSYVNAPVHRDVVTIFGNAELGPKADIRGEVVVLGGSLTRDPAAYVRRGVQQVMGFPAGASEGLRAWARKCLVLLRPLAFDRGVHWAWGVALGSLGLYLAIALMLRGPVDRCVKTLQEHPGKTVLASLLTMVLTPVLFVVLTITLLGIAFIPVAGFAMMVATIFGKVAVLAWIGRGVLRLFDGENKLHTALAVLVGGVIVLLLYVVPVLGFLVFMALGILALGAVVLTLLQLNQERRRPTPPPAFGAPGTGPFPNGPAGSGGPQPATAAAAAAGTSAAYEATVSPPGSPSSYGASTPGASAAFAGENASATSAASPDARPEAEGSAAASANAAASESSSSASGPSAAGASAGLGGAAPGGPAYAVPPGSPPPGAAAPIDVRTYERAGFWVRMLALFIDVAIIGVALMLLNTHGRLFLLGLATYAAIMWKMKGTTVGGLVCNLQVVRLDGRPVDWSTAIVRALGCFLSLIVLFLGFLWIAFDQGRQAWHDKLAGTVVLRVPQGVSLI